MLKKAIAIVFSILLANSVCSPLDDSPKTLVYVIYKSIYVLYTTSLVVQISMFDFREVLRGTSKHKIITINVE